MDDLISRQMAIDEVCKMMRECFGADEEELDAIEVTLHELSPAQLERARGHWIVWGGMDIPENHGRHKCSECGEFASVRYEKPLIKEYLSDFCPSCGADMRKERKG